MRKTLPSCLWPLRPWRARGQGRHHITGTVSWALGNGCARTAALVLAVAVCATALPSGAAWASPCKAPKTPPKATLVMKPVEARYRHDLDTAAIQDIVNEGQGYVSGPWHQAGGITRAGLSVEYETSFYISKAQGAGYCAALAEVIVTVEYHDMMVFVGSEYPEGSCEYEAILTHEKEHVEINRDVLESYEGKLRDAILRVLKSQRTIFVHRKGEANSAYLLEFERQVQPVLKKMSAERGHRNGKIDTQDNYRRVWAQCGGWRNAAEWATADPGPADAQDETGGSEEPLEGGGLEGSSGLKVISGSNTFFD